ncbi:hypothetical protein D3C80_1658770 [compost metagenome]
MLGEPNLLEKIGQSKKRTPLQIYFSVKKLMHKEIQKELDFQFGGLISEQGVQNKEKTVRFRMNGEEVNVF